MPTGNQNLSREQRAAAEKRKAAKKRKRAIVLGIEILLILGMVFAILKIIDKTNDSESGPLIAIKEEEINVELSNDDLQVDVEKKEGYVNIALFGLDARNKKQLLSGSRSDATMVASINTATGDIKLISVYRDTFLNIGSNQYIKCNHAYSYGGAEQAVSMLERNLDIQIDNFVTVGYQGLRKVIDGLGGVYIDVDSEELKHINNYQIDIAKALGQENKYNPVTDTGYQLLDGIQASAYCRIRYTKGDDFKRTERQREVIQAIEEQAKKTSVTTLLSIFDEAVDDIYTDIKVADITELIKNIANYQIVETEGFPNEKTVATIGSKGSSVIPMDLKSNVVWLHNWLYGEDGYSVPERIEEYSDAIKRETSEYISNQ